MKIDPSRARDKPIVLCFSGHDPSGGAGIQADIETLQALNCQPATVITCLTVQNSVNVKYIHPISADLMTDQLANLASDYQFAGLKIGLLGSIQAVDVIVNFIEQFPTIPVVLDPVLAAGGGKGLSSEQLKKRIQDQLIPHCTLITPNSPEARILTGQTSLEECANLLLDRGAKSILITGTHEDTEHVTNSLFLPQQTPVSLQWPRLPNSYHGSGCTLASACAAELACGKDLITACNDAQQYTWTSLSKGWQPGKGQHFPRRLNMGA